MNVERPPSTASISSSTTLRPRNRRQTHGEDEDSQTIAPQWLDGPPTSSSPSRASSPIPSKHPSRPTRTDRAPDRSRSTSRFLGVPGLLGSQVTPSSFAAGLWGSTWSSLQGIASDLIGSDSSRVSSAGHSPTRRRQPTGGSSGQNTSAPPAQWGPSGGGDKQLGAGTREDRIAKVQAQKRKTLLAANGHIMSDTLGRYKRRDSDERNRASVPPSENDDRDALVYIHEVKPADTLAGVMIKYNCDPNVFRKANRLWPNDSIQVRKTVVLPVDACGIKGRKISEPESSSGTTEAGRIEDIMPKPMGPHAPWASTHEPLSDKQTPFSSIPTSPSISVTPSSPEEPPWRHDSWVMIEGFPDAVEIARLSRRTLGYFPRSRRKSQTFSELGTPSASIDLPRGSSQGTSPPRRYDPRSSSGSYLHLQGPGGVGTMGKNVKSPGPAQDGLNKLFATHLPNVAPRSSFESEHSASSHTNGIENIGGAVEGWVRKLATKAAKTVQPPTPGGPSGIGDLIELSEDAFEVGNDEDEDDGRRKILTNSNPALGVGAWSAEQERLLQERFPPRGRVVDESHRRGKSS
ncbi:hypothetical protein N7G274_001016 [Stereocaulon virgatum]|uniref:LysM domain-containing protein n=1 Tax=Stereocaulon virgatum TaxID=373712 RepID=A0ABR4APF8_9LECA